MEQHWIAEEFSNSVKREATTWGLRYDPTPVGKKNTDGSISFSLAIPALLFTEYVGEPAEAASRVADALNSAPTLAAENERLKALVADLNTGITRLYSGYVNSLEAGRDRIVFLGGDCDPVDVMEAGDPALIAARALIARAKEVTS